MTELINSREAALILMVSDEDVRKLVRCGKLDGAKIDGRYVVCSASVQRFRKRKKYKVPESHPWKRGLVNVVAGSMKGGGE